MPDDEAAQLEIHLGTCAECFQQAREISAEVSAAEEASAEVQREQLTIALAVLATAEAAKGNTALADRLAKWARTGKAWGAVQLEVARESVRSAVQPISEAMIPAALQFVSIASATPRDVEHGAIRTRGSVAASFRPQVGLDLRRHGEELSIALQDLPIEAGPLVLLLPVEGGVEPQCRKLQHGGAQQKWTARFDQIPNGKYLFLVEPPVQDRTGLSS
jgi:hypothetical protein